MIRTNLSIEKVPTTWIFEHYCKLQERLHGQDVKISSMFNPDDKTPSMSIYYSSIKDDYVYKDFSSGRGGDGVSLVSALNKIPYNRALIKVIDDYNSRDTGDYAEVAVQEHSKFKVAHEQTRKWNELDVKFWTQFGIGSTVLNKYNIKPLAQYSMVKENDDDVKDMIIKGNHIYGYFKTNGELYKVYQPMRRDYKFFNVAPYIQGSEQLIYSQPTLIICSSLKDMCSLTGLSLDVETIAPASENSMLSKNMLSAMSVKYKKIATLFDNDTAGHTAMRTYEEKYGIPGIYLKLAKDLSDSVRDYGAVKTKKFLKPLITNI